ncbi:hypothetical protein SBV1_300027 [Verrucomicrobia bacterium]|nr:hypothetical protein SBV1_300027 [Verrucomicrobiota bacterium]
MNGHHGLIDRVHQMREAGDSIDEIASALNISWDVLGRIVRRFETEAVLAARSSRFLETIRKANDLDKEWKVSYLVQALRPKAITQNALIHHYKWEERSAICLRQLMDLAISEEDHPRPGYQLTPLLRVRCVGIEGFWSLVSRLTQADLGERCNQEWKTRLERLRRCSRVVGGGGSWSKPCEPPADLLSLMATALP